MISLLRGLVRYKSPYQITLDAGGIGYEVLCSRDCYERAPEQGQTFEILTRLIVREDSMTLYGFASPDERTFFDNILAVSGIGPKTAIGILSATSPGELREAILTNQVRTLTSIPGVGKKTAERMIVELRDKLIREDLSGADFRAPETFEGAGSARSEALQALVALGYQRAVAEKAIREVLRDGSESATPGDLVRAALRKVANN